MNEAQLKQANLYNLTALWTLMGARPCDIAGLADGRISLAWPNRCWFDYELNMNSLSSLMQGLEHSQKDVIIPIYAQADNDTDKFSDLIIRNGFSVISLQTAMYLDLNAYARANTAPNMTVREEVELQQITSLEDILVWTDIASRAFAYVIDESVIIRAASNADVRLYLLSVDQQAVATAMIFLSHDVIGLHQMGVLPEYRGRGLASHLMGKVIAGCDGLRGRYITLQASAAAESLYRRLGFKKQFMITNYQRLAKRSI